jgi:uncharacterized membrane protein YdjX (TVP38/TMEM64 family)
MLIKFAAILDEANSNFGFNLVFIGLYAVATLLFLPGSLLTLAGGALFGPLT